MLQLLRIWLNLFTNSLIASTFALEGEVGDLPPIPLRPPANVIDRVARDTDNGLFSSLTSTFWSYAADDPPEPSEEELNSTLCTVDCVRDCDFEDHFARIQ